MKFQYTFLLAFLLAQADSTTAAFTINVNTGSTSTIGNARSSTSIHARVPTHEESAAQMTQYLARSHEAKIKAVKDLEDKKNSEIKELRAKLNGSALVHTGGTSSNLATSESKPLPVTKETIEILQKKLNAYQTFMSDYVVKAQAEKRKAVQEAECTIAEKYNAKLNAFLLEGTGSSSVIGVGQPLPKLFQDRNVMVAAAAKAGKSRWGDKEVARAAESASVPVSSSTVAAAAHTISDYDKRNAFIAAAASAGKQYRWGDKEEGRAIDSSVTAALPSVGGKSGSIQAVQRPDPIPEDYKTDNERVVDADHGLRADGGVGGLSLADRVTNGAAAPTTGISSSFFQKRNAHIAAAATAGKQSRWGVMEEEKAIEYAYNALPSASQNIVVLPEVEAADHGLRADGGVSGPSLAERINLGAKLLH